MSADFRDIAFALADARPNMRASTLVALALAVENSEPRDLSDAKGLGRWARRQPEVSQYIESGQKIHAIKELRGLTGASLLQAKNAIEAIS